MPLRICSEGLKIIKFAKGQSLGDKNEKYGISEQ